MQFVYLRMKLMRGRHLHILYIFILLVLAALVKIPRYPDAGVFTRVLEQENDRLDTLNSEQADDYYDEFKNDYSLDAKGTYAKCMTIRDSTRKLLSQLEIYKKRLQNTGAEIRNSATLFAKSKERRHVKKAMQRTTVADSIQQSLNNYLSFLAKQPHPKVVENLVYNLPINQLLKEWPEQLKTDRWLRKVFDNTTTKEAVALISALQNIILSSEEIIIWEVIVENSPGCNLGFAVFQCIAVPNVGWVFPGQTVEAILFVAQYNRGVDPIITTTTGKIDTCINGIVYWSKTAKQYGVKTVSGTITSEMYDSVITLPWQFQYYVGPANVSLQLDKMNICYRGMYNPVTISLPGYPASKLRVRTPGAVVTQTSDTVFGINVSNTKANTIYAYADALNNKNEWVTVAGMKIVIKDPPLPVVALTKEMSYQITVGDARKLTRINTVSTDEDINIDYTVTGYWVSIKKQDKTFIGPLPVVSQDLSTEAKVALRNTVPGDRILISDITARRSDGKHVELLPGSFLVN